ncbi:MAG: radical SAM family heme chaperone HemW [Gammaproteobacteria bacterium]
MNTESIGLYIHIPWCERKCPYCDFNSHRAPQALAEGTYVTALLADLDDELRTLQAGGGTCPVLGSIFIGGGTPSLFGAPAIARLLDGVAARMPLVDDIEITLEANPGSAEVGRFAGYRAAGINRLSLGIQSFDDARLVALGRVHDASQAQRAIDGARSAGFDNFNLDLMFGLPGAAPDDSLRDLEQAIAAHPAHISWYQLTIEPGTAFSARPPALPEHDRTADEQDAGQELLALAGYRQYEISAYARPGRQARHNLNYWAFGDYLGIGAGAHGKLTGADARIRRREKVRHPDRYVKLAASGRALASEHLLADADRLIEFMLNALRLRDGFTLSECARRTGIATGADALTMPLALAVTRGWLTSDGERVCPTALGYRFLNDVLMLFVDSDETGGACSERQSVSAAL